MVERSKRASAARRKQPLRVQAAPLGSTRIPPSRRDPLVEQLQRLRLYTANALAANFLRMNRAPRS